MKRPINDDLVVDTSALMAMLLDEDKANACELVLSEAHSAIISDASLLELRMVATSQLGEQGGRIADDLVQQAGIDRIPVTEQLADLAFDAWQKYGKGRHPAALNYGDCFTYALASHADLPLLCVGNDFAQTDLRLAVS